MAIGRSEPIDACFLSLGRETILTCASSGLICGMAGGSLRSRVTIEDRFSDSGASSSCTITATMSSTGRPTSTRIGSSSGSGPSKTANWVSRKVVDVILACGQARANQRPVAVQMDDTHLGSPAGEEVAIAALEHRAGDHARLARLPPAIDPVCDPFEQRPLVAVIEWMASVHFADVRCRMEVGALLEWPVESLREGRRDRGFPAARDACDNQEGRIVRHGGLVRR